MIEVYIWKGSNVGRDVSIIDGAFDAPPGFNWGHTSMAVNDGLPAGRQYISWWPGKSIKQGFVQAEPYMPEDEKEDTKLEDGKKPTKLVLSGLDETAIKRWWRRRKSSKSSEYRAWGANCSTTVYMGLVAGGSHRYTPLGEGDMPWFGDELCDPESLTCQYWVWYPLKVLSYVERVQQGLIEARKKNPRRGYKLLERVMDKTVKRALTKALHDDGKLTLQEVKFICKSATDGGKVTKREIRDLRILAKLSKSMDERSRNFIKAFLRKHR